MHFKIWPLSAVGAALVSASVVLDYAGAQWPSDVPLPWHLTRSVLLFAGAIALLLAHSIVLPPTPHPPGIITVPESPAAKALRKLIQ